MRSHGARYSPLLRERGWGEGSRATTLRLVPRAAPSAGPRRTVQRSHWSILGGPLTRAPQKGKSDVCLNRQRRPVLDSAKRFRKPNARMAGWKIVESTELPITELLVKLRRLECEGVEIARAAALRSRGRFRGGHELRADPMLVLRARNPEPIDQHPLERQPEVNSGFNDFVFVAADDPARRPVGLQADPRCMRGQPRFNGTDSRFAWRRLRGECQCRRLFGSRHSFTTCPVRMLSSAAKTMRSELIASSRCPPRSISPRIALRNRRCSRSQSSWWPGSSLVDSISSGCAKEPSALRPA